MITSNLVADSTPMLGITWKCMMGYSEDSSNAMCRCKCAFSALLGSNETYVCFFSTRIAIAGTIGTGLFLGSGHALSGAGPLGALIAYALVGTVAYS